jgi:hypothetical protein
MKNEKLWRGGGAVLKFESAKVMARGPGGRPVVTHCTKVTQVTQSTLSLSHSVTTSYPLPLASCLGPGSGSWVTPARSGSMPSAPTGYRQLRCSQLILLNVLSKFTQCGEYYIPPKIIPLFKRHHPKVRPRPAIASVKGMNYSNRMLSFLPLFNMIGLTC